MGFVVAIVIKGIFNNVQEKFFFEKDKVNTVF